MNYAITPSPTGTSGESSHAGAAQAGDPMPSHAAQQPSCATMADAPLVELVRRLHSGRTLADAIRKVRGRRIGLTRKLAKSNAATAASGSKSLSQSDQLAQSSVSIAGTSAIPATASPDQQAGIDIPPAPR
jgi:hypothetical protein